MKQINFSLRCVLTCDASWVQVAKYVHHMNSTRNFAVKVDARNLPEGVHATRSVPLDRGRREAVGELERGLVEPDGCWSEAVWWCFLVPQFSDGSHCAGGRLLWSQTV